MASLSPSLLVNKEDNGKEGRLVSEGGRTASSPYSVCDLTSRAGLSDKDRRDRGSDLCAGYVLRYSCDSCRVRYLVPKCTK